MSNTTATLTREDRKRLGQYFTGVSLARVLVAMANVRTHSTVIDPMAGSGDMLAAARDVGNAQDLTAVEIDPDAAGSCRVRFNSSIELRVASAFDPATWAGDTDRAWDVVITNPPYVRYQRGSRAVSGRVDLPSAADIRTGLLQIIDERRTLSPDEREIFRSLVDGYSGLADLAVPSWLLCASLVANGGRLAMLVPDTWLSRDYAAPVLYVLRRFFDLEVVVEDGDATWFEDALVRTTLVVARRVSGRPSGLLEGRGPYVHARLSSAAGDGRSLVGSLHPRAAVPELRFADRLRRVVSSAEPDESPGLTAEAVDDAQMRDRLAGQLSKTSWGRRIEPTATMSSGQGELPRDIREILGCHPQDLCALEDLGWRVGQGLRTGANRFFYGERIDGDAKTTTVAVDRELAADPIVVPNEILHVVVRRQQDISSKGGVAHESQGRLLYLSQYALAEDISVATKAGVHAPYLPLTQTVSDHVRRAASLNIGTDDEPRLVAELSAVATNVRRADPSRPDRSPRFWYQLPPLAARHTGELFVARVCYGHPAVLANPRRTVIDANFSTLWRQPGQERLDPAALQALLKSSWSIAVMELAGTVLGGGALKLEATQIRRLPLPAAAESAAADLARLGQAMYKAHTPDVQDELDQLVWGLIGVKPAQALKIRRIADDSLRNRMPAFKALR